MRTKNKTADLVPEQAERHRVGDVERQRLEVEARLIELEVDAPARVLKRRRTGGVNESRQATKSTPVQV